MLKLFLVGIFVTVVAIFGEEGAFVSLGHIKGKMFFYEDGARNWDQANALCKQAGMTVAEITTIQEQEFLKDKFAAGGFNGDFWTGGRDVLSLNQFVWESSNSTISSNLRFWPYIKQLTCLTYYASSNEKNGYLASKACSNNFKTLCDLSFESICATL